MKNKLIKILYDYWKSKDNNNRVDDVLLNQLKRLVYEDNIKGAETLLDWCRDDFEDVQKEYQTIYDLTDEQFQELLERNFGDNKFMYDDIDYLEKLEYVWNLCNWYLDYLNMQISEEWLLNQMEN